MEGKKVLSPKDVSEECGCSLRLIYRNLRSNVIPHTKLGDRYLISRQNLDTFLTGEAKAANNGTTPAK